MRVVTLDTGRLFEETHQLMQEARDRLGLPIEVVFPDPKEVEELVSGKGPNQFYKSVENRESCCQVRKIHPLNRALEGAAAWIVGLRREQPFDRSVVQRLSRDGMHGGIWKVCPLPDWSWEDMLRYIRENDVPIDPLHARGFPSIGCAPCTRAVEPGADPRSGRS